jgi:hypothetical protein
MEDYEKAAIQGDFLAFKFLRMEGKDEYEYGF